VTDADRAPLDAESFNLHLVYDGNPPGLGMGIKPTETLHPYCLPCQQQQVTDHVRGIMKQDGIAGPITITRRRLFPQNHRIVEETDRWEVSIDDLDKGAVENRSGESSQP